MSDTAPTEEPAVLTSPIIDASITPSDVTKDVVIIPPTARQPLKLTVQIGMLEAIFTLMQYIFGTVIFTAIIRGSLDWLLSGVYTPYACSWLYTSIGGLLSTTWIVYRFSTIIKTSFSRLLQRMFAPAGDSFSFTVPTLHLSSTAILVVAAQAVAFVVMLIIQRVAGLDIYSLDNVSQDGRLNWLFLAEVVILAPVREELVFRGVLLATFYRRVGGQSPMLKLRAVYASALFFGGIHAINFFSTDSSPVYVSIQVLFGLLIGVVFAADYMQHGITGCLVMHAVNNLCSSFVSRRDGMDDPVVVAGYIQGAVVFAAFAMLAVRKLAAADNSRFPVIDGMGIEPLPYSIEDDVVEKPKKEKKKRKAKAVPDTDVTETTETSVDGAVEEKTDEHQSAPASETTPVVAELPAIRSRRGKTMQ